VWGRCGRCDPGRGQHLGLFGEGGRPGDHGAVAGEQTIHQFPSGRPVRGILTQGTLDEIT
jgi:hypothetical protein